VSLEDDRVILEKYCDGLLLLINDPKAVDLASFCEAEREIVSRFYDISFRFVQRRINNPIHTGEIVHSFWEKVIQGALCAYDGRGGASVKTFLLKVLYYHMVDQIRVVSPESQFCNIDDVDPPDRATLPDSKVIKSQLQQIVSKILRTGRGILFQRSRNDSLLIDLIPKGFSNRKILREGLVPGLRISEASSSEDIEKAENALKKRFQRAKERFAAILELLCIRNRISVHDFIENCPDDLSWEFLNDVVTNRGADKTNH
jgi:hypothetical protein